MPDMRGTYCLDCNPAKPNTNALDFSLRERLWELTATEMKEVLEKKGLPIPDSVVFKW